jgi:hypothetical protein
LVVRGPAPSGCAAATSGFASPLSQKWWCSRPPPSVEDACPEPFEEDSLPTPEIWVHIAINVVSRLNKVEKFRSLLGEELSLREFLLDQILLLQESLELFLVPRVIKELLGSKLVVPTSAKDSPTGAQVLPLSSQMSKTMSSSVQVVLPQCIPYVIRQGKMARSFKARPPQLMAFGMGPAVPSCRQACPIGKGHGSSFGLWVLMPHHSLPGMKLLR